MRFATELAIVATLTPDVLARSIASDIAAADSDSDASANKNNNSNTTNNRLNASIGTNSSGPEQLFSDAEAFNSNISNTANDDPDNPNPAALAAAYSSSKYGGFGGAGSGVAEVQSAIRCCSRAPRSYLPPTHPAVRLAAALALAPTAHHARTAAVQQHGAVSAQQLVAVVLMHPFLRAPVRL